MAASRSTREFVLDSGTSNHLIGHDQLTMQEEQTIRPLRAPTTIQSANAQL